MLGLGPTAEKSPNSQRDTGASEKNSAKRGRAGDALTERAAGFAGVRKTHPRADLSTASIPREWFPVNFVTGFAIQRQLRALVGASAIAGVDLKNYISRFTCRQAHGDGLPFRNFPFRERAQGSQSSDFEFFLRFCLHSGGPRRCVCQRHGAAAQAIEQIVGPLIGHHR